MEIPYLNKLKNEFDPADFQIIEVSIDEEYSDWERATQLENIDKEESYIISNWKISNLYRDYSIKSIPRYLLFDRDGKILNEDAPRPSDQELYKEIEASI